MRSTLPVTLGGHKVYGVVIVPGMGLRNNDTRGIATDVHYLVLKDEDHGFSRTESIVTTYKAVARFLARHIFGDHSAEVVD